MRDELLKLSKARLADLVTELWDRNARMRGRLVKQQNVIDRLVKQQNVIDRLVERVKVFEGRGARGEEETNC